MKIKLTHAQRANCLKLIAKLESLPVDYSHFTMSTFVGRRGGNLDGRLEEQYARKNGGVEQIGCGTVACAVGHGPSAGVLFRPQELIADCFKWRGEWVNYNRPNWFEYSRRFVPDGTAWEWVFGGQWARTDNHHYGAAARLRWLVEGREIPEEFVTSDHKPKRKFVELYALLRKNSAPARA